MAGTASSGEVPHVPTQACPVPPRGHPASFQSPSWLARPTSLLVRTHPYQPFLLAPVPSRLRRRIARPRPSYLRTCGTRFCCHQTSRMPDLGRYCLLVGRAWSARSRDARVPSPLVQAHPHAPVPGPSPRPGPKSAALLISHHRRPAGPTSKGTTWLAMNRFIDRSVD